MNRFVVVLLVCFAGGQFQTSSGQSFTATKRIRIQCVADGGMMGAPSTPPTTTTTGPTTTTVTTTTTTDPSATTTAAPAATLPPVESGGGNGGSATIVYWSVNWSNALNNASGSLLVVSESSSQYRCLGKNPSGNTIGIDGPRDIPTSSRFSWNFVSVFNSVTWTYQYQITCKSNNRCLRKVGNVWDLAVCSTSKNTMLFNLLS